jgi:ubiquinone/menaquinone biosynthesis C-methylase UbiE
MSNTLTLWNSYMSNYDCLTKVDGYTNGLRDIARAAEPLNQKRVLDAGSGTGNLSLILKDAGAEVLSCDISATAIRKHREKDPVAKIIQLSLEDPLPMESGSFDLVCCASVLFALNRRGCLSALSEFNRILRPSGKLVVTVAAPEQRNRNLIQMHLTASVTKCAWLRGLVRSIVGIPSILRVMYYNRSLRQLPDWQGYHRFTNEELQGFLQTAGFREIRIDRTYGGNFFLATALK